LAYRETRKLSPGLCNSSTKNLASGKLKPKIAKTFPLTKIQEAHRYMESNQQLGKIEIKV
jgi:NADPH:quinone reductase-like Zn-dependent oxidoreductase